MIQKLKPDPLVSEDMPEVVRLHLQRFRETPTPDPVAWQAGRAAFLNEARQMAAQRVVVLPVARREGRMGRTIHSIIPMFKRSGPVGVLLRVALILTLLTGASVGAVAASQNSLPGSPIYVVKTAWENTQTRLTVSPEARVDKAITMSQTRVEELQELAASGEAIPEEVVQRYALHLNAAIQAMGELPEAIQNETRARLRENLTLQELVLEQTQERVNQNAGDDTPVREMAGILLRTRERLQEPAGNPPETRPAEPPRGQNPEAPAPGPGGNDGAPMGPNPTENAPEPNPTETTPDEPGNGPGGPGFGPGVSPSGAAPGPSQPGTGPSETEGGQGGIGVSKGRTTPTPTPTTTPAG